LMDTVENALSQRTVVTIEMMPASRADDLCLSVKQATCGVILVSAIEALNHGWIDRRERRLGWQRFLLGPAPKNPATRISKSAAVAKPRSDS